jgi:hypothetical protein
MSGQHVYAPRADANHQEVAGWYEALYCLVKDVHKLPGFGDLAVRITTKRGFVINIVEIKTGDGKLTSAQATFARDWGSVVVMVQTRDDVFAHVERVRSCA